MRFHGARKLGSYAHRHYATLESLAAKLDILYSHSGSARRGGRMEGFRGGAGKLTLKPVRVQTTDSGIRRVRHVVLEEGTTVSNSARYPQQVCSVRTKHILRRFSNLATACWDAVVSDSSRIMHAASPTQPHYACHVGPMATVSLASGAANGI